MHTHVCVCVCACALCMCDSNAKFLKVGISIVCLSLHIGKQETNLHNPQTPDVHRTWNINLVVNYGTQEPLEVQNMEHQLWWIMTTGSPERLEHPQDQGQLANSKMSCLHRARRLAHTQCSLAIAWPSCQHNTMTANKNATTFQSIMQPLHVVADLMHQLQIVREPFTKKLYGIP